MQPPSAQQLTTLQEMIADGSELWRETQERDKNGIHTTWMDFMAIVHTDLRELAPFVNWGKLHEYWEYTKAPASGTEQVVTIRCPEMKPIEVRYEFSPDPLQHKQMQWHRKAWPTQSQGFFAFRIRRYDGARYFYADSLLMAVGAAVAAKKEHDEQQAFFRARLNEDAAKGKSVMLTEYPVTIHSTIAFGDGTKPPTLQIYNHQGNNTCQGSRWKRISLSTLATKCASIRKWPTRIIRRCIGSKCSPSDAALTPKDAPTRLPSV